MPIEKRELDNFPQIDTRLTRTCATSVPDSALVPKPAKASDVVYDALDLRLMATFPASDATAQY